MRGDDGSPSSTVSPAVPLFFRDDMEWTLLVAMRRYYDKHQRLTEDTSEA